MLLSYILCYQAIDINHSSGAVWESRWPSWAVRPNEPSGFREHKELLNHARIGLRRIGLRLFLIFQPTSEDIKHHFNIDINDNACA